MLMVKTLIASERAQNPSESNHPIHASVPNEFLTPPLPSFRYGHPIQIMNTSRRSFLQHASAWTLGFAGLQKFANQSTAAAKTADGYGPLVKDPNGVLDLPKGFQARIISRSGDPMSDGFITPAASDGMAAFPAKDGRTIIIRNHEVNPDAKPSTGAFGDKNQLLAKLKPAQIYDAGPRENPSLGGTTTLVYDTKTGKVDRSFLSLAGTLRNCAGGPTPWNSWITCEETVLTRGRECALDHGFNFEAYLPP